MAAEEAVVEAVTRLTTMIVIEGVKYGLKIAGGGLKGTAVMLYGIARRIAEKEKSGKALTPGEVTCKKLLTSGEEIHSFWISKDDLVSFSQIAKKLGITFAAAKDGDAIEKSKQFLKGSDNENVEFTENYKDKVFISYNASDEIRMQHILEMFDYSNLASIVKEDISKDETPIDEVEQFMRDNGVEFELPPEVIDSYEEVKENDKNVSEAVSEKDSSVTETEISSKAQDSGDKTTLCFEQFGFDSMPSKNDYNASYIDYIKENKINTSEPNYITALYEQGCKLIDGTIKKDLLVQTTVPKSKTQNNSKTKKAATEVAECFKFFGLNKIPSVQELKNAYTDFIKNSDKTGGSNIVDNMYNAAVDLIDKPNKDGLKFCYEFFGFKGTPTKSELENAYKNYVGESLDVPNVAKSVYENALEYMQKSESIRQTLQAKQELHNLHNSDNSVAKNITKQLNKTEQNITK